MQASVAVTDPISDAIFKVREEQQMFTESTEKMWSLHSYHSQSPHMDGKIVYKLLHLSDKQYV